MYIHVCVVLDLVKATGPITRAQIRRATIDMKDLVIRIKSKREE